MKTKQEQIEEMKTLLLETYVEWLDKPTTDKKPNLYDTDANKLYNAGYRKIPENAVVLTKEDYEDLKVAADNYDPFWFCSFGGCEGARKGCKDDCEMSIFVQERKKTAKEILNGMLKKMYKLTGCGVPYHVKAFIKEFAKEYGVAVEE